MVRESLEELSKVEGIKGSLVVDREGLIIASVLKEDLEGEKIGSLAASIAGLTTKALRGLKKGQLIQFLSEFAQGKVILIDLEESVLIVISDKKVNLGMLRLELQEVAQKIVAALKA